MSSHSNLNSFSAIRKFVKHLLTLTIQTLNTFNLSGLYQMVHPFQQSVYTKSKTLETPMMHPLIVMVHQNLPMGHQLLPTTLQNHLMDLQSQSTMPNLLMMLHSLLMGFQCLITIPQFIFPHHPDMMHLLSQGT